MCLCVCVRMERDGAGEREREWERENFFKGLDRAILGAESVKSMGQDDKMQI